MFLAAEKLHANDGLAIGLIDGIAEDPLAEAARRIATLATSDTHTGATGSGIR